MKFSVGIGVTIRQYLGLITARPRAGRRLRPGSCGRIAWNTTSAAKPPAAVEFTFPAKPPYHERVPA